MTSFHKKYWRHCKNDPMEQIWYGTVYKKLLILIFQFLTNYVKDFTEGSPVNPPPLPLPNNLKKV